MKLSLEKIINTFIELVNLSIILFVPLYFAIFLKNNNVFELNKIVFFKNAIYFLLILVLLKILFFSYYKKYLLDKIKKYFKIVFVAPLIYILLLIISTLFSVDSYTSLWGYYNRQQGLVSHLFYFLFYILLFVNITSKKQIVRVLYTMSLSSIVVCAYGILQHFSLDPFVWVESTSYRITSTFGQPNFLASFLLLAIPINIYLLLSSQRIIAKIWSSLALVLCLLSLYFTLSRSAWLALLLGIFVYLFFAINKYTKLKYVEKKKLIIYSLLFALILTIGFSTLYNNKSFKSRINSALTFNAGSTASRINNINAGWSAFKKSPIIGYGMETQGEVFSASYEKDWAYFNNINTYPNRAHNIIIDTLITGGILSLAGLIVLLYFFFYTIKFNYQNQRESLLNLFLGLSIFMYLSSLLLGFSVVATDVYFWLIISVAVIIKTSEDKTETELISNKQASGVYKYSFNVLAIVLIIVSIMQIEKNIDRLITDYYYRELKVAMAKKDYFAAYILYPYINKNIDNKYYKQEFAKNLADILYDDIGEAIRHVGKEIFKEILPDLDDGTFESRLARANIYMTLSDVKNDEYFNKAKAEYDYLISYSPEMPKLKRGLADLYLKNQDYIDAEKVYIQAIINLPIVDVKRPLKKEVGPTINESLSFLNEEHKKSILFEEYLLFIGLGDAMMGQANYEEALSYFSYAEDVGLSNKHYQRIAKIHQINKNYDTAIEYYKLTKNHDPNNYLWSYYLGKIHFMMGDYTTALERIQEAIVLSPKNAMVSDIYKKIKKANDQ